MKHGLLITLTLLMLTGCAGAGSQIERVTPLPTMTTSGAALPEPTDQTTTPAASVLGKTPTPTATAAAATPTSAATAVALAATAAPLDNNLPPAAPAKSRWRPIWQFSRPRVSA